MIMRRLLFFLALQLAFVSSIFAQGQITKIRGRVIDAQTREPIAYVNIAFRGLPIGTITSEKGEF